MDVKVTPPSVIKGYAEMVKVIGYLGRGQK